ncbi:MAG: hypothetical protein OMM_15298, partial [Candidatus Magnetoglobus multicellularis str. Araruama]
MVLDAENLGAISTEKSDIEIIATDSVSLANDDSPFGMRGGNTFITILSGMQTVTQPLDAGGEDINFVSNDVAISEDIRSIGASLNIRPVNNAGKIFIGDNTSGMDLTDILHLDTSEISKLQNGFKEIVIGSTEGQHEIIIGDQNTDTGTIEMLDPFVIQNSQPGGETYIYDDIIGTDDASLTIKG